MTSKTESLVAKLVAVAASIRNIEKNGHNTAQKYDFVSEADVVRTVIPALLEKGILFLPKSRRVVGIERFETRSGSTSFLTTIESTWLFTDGDQELEVMTIGQGTDTGDKGAYKGMTGDKKYAILQALGIATGDDPEGDSEQDKPAPKKRTTTTRRASRAKAEPEDDDDEDEAAQELAAQKRKMFALAKKAGYDLNDDESKKEFQELVKETTGKFSSKQMTSRDVAKMILNLKEEAGEAVDADDVAAVTGGEVVA